MHILHLIYRQFRAECTPWVVLVLFSVLSVTVREGMGGTVARPPVLVGVGTDLAYGEQITTWTLADGVLAHVNIPSSASLDITRPTRVILYALPNGNSIAWTVGKRLAPGDDWHFAIQHIGAQTRFVRQLEEDANVVVIYLEAPRRSWPAWRRAHPDAPAQAVQIVRDLAGALVLKQPRMELFAHSGGGSFVFAFLDSSSRISRDVTRIALLDADYGYSDEQHHGDKLLAWLREDRKRTLFVAAYDDREVKLNGKPIVEPTGGTWRATQRMIARFAKEERVTSSTLGDLIHVRALGQQVHFYLHTNPQRSILHTVLVERNGFAHAALVNTRAEGRAPMFFGNPAYTRWIGW